MQIQIQRAEAYQRRGSLSSNMADFRRRRWAMRSRPPIRAPRLIEEEITPSSGWIQLPEFHCLLVDLPGFKEDDIEFNVEESGSIVISGKRRTGEEKQVHFKKSFDVPEDGDIKSITRIFEQDTLRVIIPKVAREMKEEPQKPNSSDTTRSTNHDTEEKGKEKEKEMEKGQTESPASSSSSHPKEEAEEEKKDETEESLAAASRRHPTEEAEEDKKYETEESPAAASRSHPKEEAEEEKRDETEESPAAASRSHPNEEAEEDKNDETEESPAAASRSHPKEEAEEEKKDETKKSPASGSSSHPKEEAEEKKKDETEGPAEEPQSKNQLIVKIIENKGILIASVLSFTLGVLLCQKFHPVPPK